MKFNRRMFFKVTATGVVGLWVGSGPKAAKAVAEETASRALAAHTIEQFGRPLLIPRVMPRARRIGTRGGPPVDYYEIALRQFAQQVLPAPHPPTTVWGYGAVAADGVAGGRNGLFHAPSLTIEAQVGTPVRIKWVNDLVDAHGHHLPHLLPVDPTLHWANPGRLGSTTTDSHPHLTGKTYVATTSPHDPVGDHEYTRYWGPVPMVTHVHGAVGVGDESDGYPEAWYLPDADDLDDHAPSGTWYEYFRGKAADRFRATWGPGHAVMQYPNDNRASTLWYHDHTLGMTRQNVYTGPAGFFIVRGGPDGDEFVRDSLTGRRAVLPGPGPRYGQPIRTDVTEIPLAIQDRSFTPDGQLFYPDTRAFFDGSTGPYLPETPVPPLWNPEFFGNTLIVNGYTWPHHEVEQRRYRFRVLNGCQSRFLILDFNGIEGVAVWQIGNEGGLLDAAVDLATLADPQRLLLGPAERADLIVDFSAVPVGHHVLGNVGPDEPYGGGVPGVDFELADAATTGRVLQFRVVPRRGRDRTTPPASLVLPTHNPLPEHSVIRRLALIEHEYEGAGPTAAMLGSVEADGALHAQMWADPVVTNPQVGDTEVWEIYNSTADAHPIHLHEVAFEVMDRQAIDVDEEEDRVALAPGSRPVPPEPWERGLKDTVVALPGEVTRIKARFTNAGQFVWHCHILEHEDNEMMLPYRIGPVQPGQPGP